MRIDSFGQEMLYSGRVQADFAENRKGMDESAGRVESRPVEFGDAYLVNISQEGYRKFSEAFSKAQENSGREMQGQADTAGSPAAGQAKPTGMPRGVEASAEAQRNRERRMLEIKGRQTTRDSYRESRRLADQQNKLQRAKFLLEGYLRTSQIDALL